MDTCGEGELPHYLQEKIQLLTEIFGNAVPVAPDSGTLPRIPGNIPVLIPMSLRFACFYQMASLLTVEVLKENLAKSEAMTCLNKLGHQEIGRRCWEALSDDDKIKKAHDMLHKPEILQGLVSGTNFDKLGPVLETLLNNEEVLTKKIEYLMSSITFTPGRMVEQMSSANDQLDMLGQPKVCLVKKYWQLFDNEFASRVHQFCSAMDIACLAPLMEELDLYHGLCSRLCWDEELQEIKNRMQRILKCQIKTLIKCSDEWSLTSWKATWSSEVLTGTLPTGRPCLR